MSAAAGRWAAALVAATLCLSARAEPASEESVERLLLATRTERLLETMLKTADTSLKLSIDQSLQGQRLSAEGQRITDEFARRFHLIMEGELSWERMKVPYVKLYRDQFTQDEVDGLLAFYESPAGKASLTKLPLLTQRSMALTQDRLGPLMQRLQQSMLQVVAEARAAK